MLSKIHTTANCCCHAIYYSPKKDPNFSYMKLEWLCFTMQHYNTVNVEMTSVFSKDWIWIKNTTNNKANEIIVIVYGSQSVPNSGIQFLCTENELFFVTIPERRLSLWMTCLFQSPWSRSRFSDCFWSILLAILRRIVNETFKSLIMNN